MNSLLAFIIQSRIYVLTPLLCLSYFYILLSPPGPDTITHREMKYLTDSLALPSSKMRNSVEYKKMTDLLSASRETTANREHWHERDEGGREMMMQKSATTRGTIGDFLTNASCPAEQRNYKRLMDLLDKYERESGMKIELTKNGFVIPLGPDMEASMQISLRQ